jgi:hypothetical protein
MVYDRELLSWRDREQQRLQEGGQTLTAPSEVLVARVLRQDDGGWTGAIAAVLYASGMKNRRTNDFAALARTGWTNVKFVSRGRIYAPAHVGATRSGSIAAAA